MQPFSFFISYRRADTAPIALLLKSEIEKRLQFVRVSVDVEVIKVGENFPQRLRGMIRGAHATIALIGKNWMPQARSENDWVVTELEYSRSEPLAFPKENCFGLEARKILPLFADCPRDFRPFDLPASIAYLNELHAEHIDYASWPSAIGPLVERLGEQLSITTRPAGDSYPQPDRAKARTQPLSDSVLTETLHYDDYDGWYVDNFGSTEFRYLVKTFRFDSFDKAADFMALVSDYCRTLDHHPEWRNVYNQVTVQLSTWDAQRRVTIYDLNLALYMNKAFRQLTKSG
jgi:pterin-4a-carbinolamine dehydratase